MMQMRAWHEERAKPHDEDGGGEAARARKIFKGSGWNATEYSKQENSCTLVWNIHNSVLCMTLNGVNSGRRVRVMTLES